MFSLATRNSLRRSTLANAAKSSRLYSSTMHDNDPEVLDTEKRRNLGKTQHLTSTPHQDSAPGWNEHLASSSEAHVKADQSKDSPESMVRKTIEYAQARHSPEERVGRREAEYERDEISGPLGAEAVKRRVTKSETYEEEILTNATASEEIVKADRGEV